MQDFRLDGKVAIVTGALGLLGQEHSAALAAAGARVVATDLDAAGVEAFAARLSTPAARVLGVTADVTDPTSLDRLRERVLDEFGRIDVLVNNAAIDDKVVAGAPADDSRFEKYSLERFRKQLDVNVTGVFLCCQRLGLPLVRQRSGSVINVASTYGVSAPQQELYRDEDGRQLFFKGPAYPASKAAVLQFTRYLAAYWGSENVRVNALSPGGVRAAQDDAFVERYSRKTPLGRMARRGDYRGALVFLASDASSYMTGANLIVDGGWTIW